MKKIILFTFLILICLSSLVLAEEKTTEIVPKLTASETKDAPVIINSEVYPVWGVPCTNYTYYAVYKDEKGREPEYMRIWLNGEWHDMRLLKGNPETGATYVYNYVPDSGSTNFYYYESSNGVGKARGSIIDSPDNGPVLFSEKLDNNEIVLLDKNGKEMWSYDTGIDWVEGVAISKDRDYIAAVTNFYIYLFSKDSNIPLWSFCRNCEIPSSLPSGNAAGIAISADGNYIAADMQGSLYLFNKESNRPLWTKNTESGAIGVDMSDDSNLIAVGAGDKIFIYDKEGNKLAEYKPLHPDYEQTGEFYQPDVTPDGKYTAVSTGCPDRRAYLFSKEGELLFRSEQLTFDSPVHKSAISDDGSLIAYSADHMQGKEILFLYDNQGKKLWGFSSSEDGTARAVSMSSDGDYIAIGTSAGHIYLFSKDNNKPLWKFTESGRFVQFGDVKLSSDGSLLAAVGTSKKIYLFSKDSNKPLWNYEANTWVTKVDFNGEYIIAGTGPREYFFEGESLGPDKIQCREVIQPEPFENYFSQMRGGEREGVEINIEGEKINMDIETDCTAFNNENLCDSNPDCNWREKDKICESITKREEKCGNNYCESPRESYENCPKDCCPPTGCIDDSDERDVTEDEMIDIDKNDDVNGDKEKGFFERIMDFFRGFFK